MTFLQQVYTFAAIALTWAQEQGTNNNFLCELDPSLSPECEPLIHPHTEYGLPWIDPDQFDGENFNIMNMEAPNYLKTYRNPCWYEELPVGKDLFSDSTYLIRRSGPTMNDMAQRRHDELRAMFGLRQEKNQNWRLRCLPYIWLLGETKCGTTDLFDKIILHPSIESGYYKEAHWYSGYRKFGAPIRDFLDTFDQVAEKIRTEVQYDQDTRTLRHHLLTMDGSAVTLWGPMQWADEIDNKDREEPEFINAHYIRHLQPEGRFVVIVRNPTERLYSHYLYFPRDEYSPELFDQLVDQCISVFNECIETRSVRACLYDKSMIKKQGIEFKNGFFFQPLLDWMEVFPREHFHVLRLEDFRARRLEELQSIYSFLELEPLRVPVETEAGIDDSKPINAASMRDQVGAMLDSTRQKLNDFFRPYNEKLAEILGDEKFLWNDYQ